MPKVATNGRRQAATLPSGDDDARTRVEAFVRQQSPAHQKTINRLRTIVKSAAPELDERMRWQQVGYLISKKDVCGIYPSSDHVNLSFLQGSTLRDPKGLLEGTGKEMRHIKVFRVEDIGEDTVKAYVREAVASIQKS